jgi:uncharacterized protein (DUF1697 family)
MVRYAAFLRGMNLGRRLIKNAELAAHVEALGGFSEVATFRASGNVIVTAEDDASPAEIAERLERGLEDALGYPVPIFLRDAAQMRAITAAEPFPPAQVAASKGKLQVSLLAQTPSAAARRATLAHATDADRLAIHGSELYWLPNGGISESALDTTAAFGPLGPQTMRTMGTIELIAAKHFAA